MNAGSNQIIFGVSGSNVNSISSISVTNGGTYTGQPDVSVSGGGGSNALVSAVVGIKSVSFTQQIVPSAVSITVNSSQGSGAELLPIYGGPNFLVTGNLYFDPNASPSPSVGIQSSPGSGATYQMTYEVAKVTLAQGSPPGSYTSQPAVTTTPSGGFFELPLFEVTYGIASVTKTVGAGQSDLFNYTAGVPALEVVPSVGTGAVLGVTYRPRLFRDADGGAVSDLYWYTADPAPSVSQVNGWADGTGTAFLPKFGINELQLDNFGNSDYDDIVDILADGEIIGEISYDVNGNLDSTTLTITQADYGYFSASAFPGSPLIITLQPRGNGTGGQISVSRCRLKAIEASSGVSYSAEDMDEFQDTGRLTCTNLKNSGGSPAALDSDPVRMTVGQAYAVSVSSEGSGYGFYNNPAWTPTQWVSISSGAETNQSAPSLSSSKRLNGISISNGGSFTAPPTFSVTAPASGNAPTISLNSVRLISIANTARGSGYSSTPAITASEFYDDINLTSLVPISGFLSLTGPWLGGISVAQKGQNYLVGDVVNFGFGTGQVSSLEVASTIILNNGIGFTSAPSIGFSGGGQTVSAVATASIAAISASQTSFPLISISDANLSTGDARKMAYALTDYLFGVVNSGNSGIRVSATRAVGGITSNLERRVTYNFNFLVEKTGPYGVKDE